MSIGIIALLALNVLTLAACMLAIWVGQNNHKALRIKSNSHFNNQVSQSLDLLNNNAAFPAVDRVPGLRRSGNCSVNDLARALFILLLISFPPRAIGKPLAVVLITSAILLLVVACCLFIHTALSHRQSFRDNARGRSPLNPDNK